MPIQCQMALMKGLKSRVSGSEDPEGNKPKFIVRRKRTLVTIVLSVDLYLLY